MQKLNGYAYSPVAPKNRRRPGRSLRHALLVTAVFSAPAAYGQTTQNAPPANAVTGLKDVVITATRQSTKLQKTPIAVTVFGNKQINEQHLTTARDLAGKVPNVLIQRAGITPLTQVFFIRGIGDADPIFDPNIAQYLDDVYLPRAINGMTDMTDLQRVEILRGPQGTLFGENADAGAIRYITRDPTDNTEGNFDIGGGSFGAFQTHGYISGPIVPGKLDGSIAFAHDTHQGYTYDPTIGKDVNNQNTSGLRGKLLATLTPNLSVELEADGTLDYSATDYYSPVKPIIGGSLAHPVYGTTDLTKSYASQYPKNDSWSGGVSSKVTYIINPNLTFKSITAYRGFSQNPVNYNNDGQPLVLYNSNPAASAPPYPPLVSISDNYIVYREQEVTQELQLLGNYDKFDFATGLYFLNENFASNRIGYVVSPTGAGLPAFPEDQIGDTKTNDYAAYAQGDYHFTDKLTGTLGGRYTIENRGFTFHGIFTNFNGFPLYPSPTNTPAQNAALKNNFVFGDNKTWYSFTPKYGLSYQFTPGLFGYASIAEGFDAGGFNNRASSLATALPYDQEKVTTYEAGVKSDWFDHRLRVNGTLFYNNYTNLQQTASVISPVTNALVSVRANAGSAHTDGFELETSAEPIDNLFLTGNASYLWTRFDSFPSPGTSVNTGKLVSATGNQLPFAPRWQLYAAANYTVPLDIPGQLTVGSDISSQTSYFSDVFNNPQGEVHPQAFIDGFVSYKIPRSRWTAILTGQNLTNRLAYQSITWAGTPNLWEGPVNPPRTVFFKLQYTY